MSQIGQRLKQKLFLLIINQKVRNWIRKIANSFLKPISNTMENGFCSLSYSEY